MSEIHQNQFASIYQTVKIEHCSIIVFGLVFSRTRCNSQKIVKSDIVPMKFPFLFSQNIVLICSSNAKYITNTKFQIFCGSQILLAHYRHFRRDVNTLSNCDKFRDILFCFKFKLKPYISQLKLQ